MDNKLHILILYTNTGSGHRTPALAIAERIEELYPGQFQITASNFFEDTGEHWFNRYIEKSWDTMLKHPFITKSIMFAGSIFHKLAPHYIRIIHKKVWHRAVDSLKNLNPDIILSTHFFPHTIAIDTREKYSLTYPIIALNPDTFETFPYWDRRGDSFLVCSEAAQESALDFGHKLEIIKIVPQALRKEFNQTVDIDKSQLRTQYSLKPNVFTIFMSDGGQGIGKIHQSIEILIKNGFALNIIAVCGKNERLYYKLLRLQQKLQSENSSVVLLPFAYTENLKELIQMSDLFIGKAGPASIIECLKLKLPVLINFLANPAEKKTAHFFVQQEVAFMCMNIANLPKKVQELMEHPHLLEEMKERGGNLEFFHDGSGIIAEIVVDTLKKKLS